LKWLLIMSQLSLRPADIALRAHSGYGTSMNIARRARKQWRNTIDSADAVQDHLQDQQHKLPRRCPGSELLTGTHDASTPVQGASGGNGAAGGPGPELGVCVEDKEVACVGR
jgi:hypothetical protein